MKNLKNVMSVITLALVMLISVNVSAQKQQFSKSEVENVKKNLRKTMNSFVEGVKPYYKDGISYSAFKRNLIGENFVKITVEGDALLKKSYTYISKNVTSKEILAKDNGEEIAKAYIFTTEYNKKNNSKNGDFVLFGNPTGNTFPDTILNKEAPCRWYQLGCWFNHIFGDYADEIFGILIIILFP